MIPNCKPFALCALAILIGLLGCDQGGGSKTTTPAAAGESSARTVGAFTFNLPPDWKTVTGAELQREQRDFEAQIRPSYARYGGSVSLESFNYFQLPNDSGMFLAWTLRIPPQKDFLATMRDQETANTSDGRRRGQIKQAACSIVQRDGVDVLKVELELANGMKCVNFHHWSPDDPGLVTMLQLGYRPDRSGAVEAAAEEMLNSLSMVSASVPASKPTAQVSTARQQEKAGILAFVAPAGWQVLSGDEERTARKEVEGATKVMLDRFQGTAQGFIGIDAFKAVRLPKKAGWFMAYTMRIPAQENYLTTMRQEQDEKVRWGKQQGIVTRVIEHGLSKIDGKEVIKLDAEMSEGARTITIYYWAENDPGCVGVISTVINAGCYADVEADLTAIFGSLKISTPDSSKTRP